MFLHTISKPFQFDGERKQFLRARKIVRDVVDEVVQDRLASPKPKSGGPTDYLSALLAESDKLNPEVLRNILVTLLFAGRDNTQNALAWAMMSLIQNPVWLEKLREESHRVLDGRAVLEYEDLGVILSRNAPLC